jgi:hypothetical protein
MTIGYLMWSTFVLALSLAPVGAAIGSGRPGLVGLALVFEAVLLPLTMALITLARLRPGWARDLVLTALGVVFFVGSLVGLVIVTLNR